MPGLQPLDRFNVPFPGAVPQSGMVRTCGAGDGRRRVWVDEYRFLRGLLKIPRGGEGARRRGVWVLCVLASPGAPNAGAHFF